MVALQIPASFIKPRKKKYQIVTSVDFAKRPNSDLFDTLEKAGVDLKIGNDESFWVEVCGKGGIASDKAIEVDCEKSTSFYGLKLSYADKEINFIPKNLNSSGLYVEMTNKVVKDVKLREILLLLLLTLVARVPLAFVCDGGKVEILNCHEVDKFQADSFLINS